MTDHPYYNNTLWATLLGFVAAVFAIVYLLACGGGDRPQPSVPRLLSCAEKVVDIITTTPRCEEIGRRLNQLLEAQAECFEALTGDKAPTWSCDPDGGAR
jgi:hypothetical protein